MLWPKNVLNVLKFYIFPFLIVVQEINLKTRTYFSIQRPTSLSLNRQPGAHCLVKTLKTDFQRREKEVIPNLKSGLKVPSEEKKKKFPI